MTDEQQIKGLIEFRRLLYRRAWEIHLELLFMERTDDRYPAIFKEKNEVETEIGNLTVKIMNYLKGV